jgi:hypothetical protein
VRKSGSGSRNLLICRPTPHQAYPWRAWSAPPGFLQKGGKTELDAIATAYAALTFPAPETAFVVANDLAQAQDRVFERIARAVRAMVWGAKTRCAPREIIDLQAGR